MMQLGGVVKRKEIEMAAQTLDEVASEWGLTLSLPKTKLLVAGMWSEDDLQLIGIRGDTIKTVPDFRLGSIVEVHGETLKEVEDRIARASRAFFGALCRPVFQYNKLSLETNRMVYRAVVMGMLLYEI